MILASQHFDLILFLLFWFMVLFFWWFSFFQKFAISMDQTTDSFLLGYDSSNYLPFLSMKTLIYPRYENIFGKTNFYSHPRGKTRQWPKLISFYFAGVLTLTCTQQKLGTGAGGNRKDHLCRFRRIYFPLVWLFVISIQCSCHDLLWPRESQESQRSSVRVHIVLFTNQKTPPCSRFHNSLEFSQMCNYLWPKASKYINSTMSSEITLPTLYNKWRDFLLKLNNGGA